ncbi:homeobox-leucine zipper protein HDG11-like [Lotus japonicus]|uniref:homeobox-leucine zipper protein HDG11-like n=1 Tax=Lotus japonicus TaxID=34305 RepID=UPI002590456D|nr:homeobox-leucine zipper protein HDG11-like [Lotus japonicus]
MGSQVSQQELQQGLIPIIGSSHDPSLASLLNQGAGGIRSSSIGLTSIIGGDSASLHNNPMEESLDFQNQKLLMKGIASTATRELAKLLLYNEPFWVLSSSQEGKLTLHPEIYEIFFPKNKHFIGPNVRAESSKDSVTVNISGMQLVEMFLDPVKWANLFPSILAKAETIKVFDSGLSSNQNGALLLMCGEMHVLSPLVQPRKFHFLRYCEHVKAGLWMITDVSVDPSRQHNPFSRSWKHPSGCMIQEIPDGSCRVFWVEHVEVDEMQTHQLFRDLVDTKIIYGAERWTKELQRMCERFTCFSEDKTQDHDHRGVICSNEGKRSVMNLACRMVKMFCESLSMTGYEMNFPSSNMENTSGIKFSVRKNTEMGQPSGTVVVATTTLWLPHHYQKVFEFLTDISKRSQWDVLAAEHSVHEIGNILVGANPGNYISLIQPLMSNTENNMVILQECSMDPMRSYIVFAPADIPAMNAAIGGGDTSMIQILPSGFVISTDGQTNIENSRGSLLTVAFQILVNSLTADELPVLDVGNAGDVLTLLDSIVENIHSALSSY